MSRRSCSDGVAGFTLIEALVALAIVAAVLGSIGTVIATTVKATRAIDQRLALAGAAETLLAALPARNLLKPGRQSGEPAERDVQAMGRQLCRRSGQSAVEPGQQLLLGTRRPGRRSEGCARRTPRSSRRSTGS